MRNSLFKKIAGAAAILLAALAASVSFASCDRGDPETTDPVQTEPDTSAAETAAAIADFTVAEGGEMKCRVVRGVDATDAEITAAVNIRRALQNILPEAKVDIVDDLTASASPGPSIIVGRTALPETSAVLETIGYGDAVIIPRADCLVVLSMTDSGMTHLGNKAGELLGLAADKEGNVVFGSDMAYTFRVSAELAGVPVIDGRLPDRIVPSGNRAYQIYFQGAKPEELDSYVLKLRSSGFGEISDRAVGDNRFTVFTDGSTAVTAYYTAANKALRIIAEPESNRCPSDPDNRQTVTTPMLTMIGRKFGTNNTYLDTDANSGYMCFVIRLSDGRFIVVDGGTYDGITSFAAAIYAKMRDQSPDPNNIVIAAWIFTHSHSDHTGGFVSFAPTYASHVTLQCVISNFPSEAEFESAGEALTEFTRWKGALGSFNSLMQYKAHTGQRFAIGDATVEFLYTHEDFVTKTRSVGTVKNNWNNSSLIFSLEIAGQKIMFTGDSQEIPNNLTANIYGSYLKSDILQVCHHGGIGGTNSLYAAIDPEVALYTTSDALVPVYISKWSYNYYLTHSLDVKEYFNSADRITTFALPYHPKSEGFIKTTVN